MFTRIGKCRTNLARLNVPTWREISHAHTNTHTNTQTHTNTNANTNTHTDTVYFHGLEKMKARQYSCTTATSRRRQILISRIVPELTSVAWMYTCVCSSLRIGRLNTSLPYCEHTHTHTHTLTNTNTHPHKHTHTKTRKRKGTVNCNYCLCSHMLKGKDRHRRPKWQHAISR